MSANPPLFANDPDNACVAYKNIRAATNPHTVAGRAHCEDLWKDFEPLADEHFISEFPIRFHERWFEMYLTVALQRAGLNIECPKPGPDVLLHAGDRRCWIEAVCATPGEPGHPDAVPEPVIAAMGDKPVVTEIPQDKIVLRLRNSLEEKARKYESYLKSGIVSEDDLLLVALNVHAVPHAWKDMEDFMMKALYGVGNLVIRMDRDTGAIVGSEHEQIATVAKLATGAEVGVQPFIDGSMGHVTGILGSRADAVNRKGRLGDDFNCLPNLTADRLWPGGVIQLGEEWIFEEADGEWQGQRRSYIEVR